MFRKIVIATVLAAISVPALAGTPRLDAREHNQRQERARLERNADRMSARIYRQKHDPQSR